MGGGLLPRSTDVNCGIYLEPHIAEDVFQDMLEEAGLKHVRLVGPPGAIMQVHNVTKHRGVIQSIAMEGTTTTLSAKVFIDGTYEGTSWHAVGQTSRGGVNRGQSSMRAMQGGVSPTLGWIGLR